MMCAFILKQLLLWALINYSQISIEIIKFIQTIINHFFAYVLVGLDKITYVYINSSSQIYSILLVLLVMTDL